MQHHSIAGEQRVGPRPQHPSLRGALPGTAAVPSGLWTRLRAVWSSSLRLCHPFRFTLLTAARLGRAVGRGGAVRSGSVPAGGRACAGRGERYKDERERNKKAVRFAPYFTAAFPLREQ